MSRLGRRDEGTCDKCGRSLHGDIKFTEDAMWVCSRCPPYPPEGPWNTVRQKHWCCDCSTAVDYTPGRIAVVKMLLKDPRIEVNKPGAFVG